MHNEIKYGLRFLVRDTLNSHRRVETLLAHERLPRERLDAVTDGLLLNSLRAAVRRIPRYNGVKLDFGTIHRGIANTGDGIDASVRAAAPSARRRHS